MDKTWLIQFSSHLTGPVSTSASHWPESAPAPPNVQQLQTWSLTFFDKQSTSAESIKRAPCFKSLQAIDYFNHLESGILIYTKASLVVVDCTGVNEQEEDCNPAKNQGVEPERYNKSVFPLVIHEGQAHSS